MIATDLVRYFNPMNGKRQGDRIVPNTIGDFLKAHVQYKDFYTKPGALAAICRVLEHEGLLVHAGSGKGSPPMSACYYSFGLKEEHAAYGTCDFLAFGFPFIREHFRGAVRPVLVEHSDGRPDIGTCFAIVGNRIVTAVHCIERMNAVVIDGVGPDAGLVSVHRPVAEVIDLAVLTYDRDPLPAVPKFKVATGDVLDEVLTMGFPPVPGFDPVQVAETANLAARSSLKASIGDVVGHGDSYLGRQEYLLVSARVKGGNSGGPVVNRSGFVIGVVTDLPGDGGAADPLGYGVATPSEGLVTLLEGIEAGDPERAVPVEFSAVEGGFRTK